jgi:P2-related tail formation protein
MSITADTLMNLLPALYRRRDAERGGVLAALLEVVAEQLAALDADVDQLYENAFVETCAPWVLPYLADLVGLDALADGRQLQTPRGEVANVIAWRRRKGLASTLEQVARDITGWPARVVEFFQLLQTTQHMQHVRPENHILDLRDANRLEWLGSPFERQARHLPPVRVTGPCGEARPRPVPADLPHLADVRRISRGRGRYNIPSIGLFVWRLLALARRQAPCSADPLDPTHFFRFDPLGADSPLFSLPQTEDDLTHLAEPANVPMRMSRRWLARDRDMLYGSGLSFVLWRLQAGAFEAVPASQIIASDLTDWVQAPPPGRIAVDPVLGRIRTGDATAFLAVSFHRGFSAQMGGGEYPRPLSGDPPVQHVANGLPAPGSHLTLTAALAAAGGQGTVQIEDAGIYHEAPALQVAGGGTLTIRAGEQRHPTWLLDAVASPGVLDITGNGTVVLDGLTLARGRIRVPALQADGSENRIRRLEIRHCTLIPGLGATQGGEWLVQGQDSLIVEVPDIEVVLVDCIVGGLRLHARSGLHLTRCIVDATEPSGIAVAGPVDFTPAGRVQMVSSTVIGRVFVTAFDLVSNSIVHARMPDALAPSGWQVAVQALRRQEGCIRFSFVPWESRVPRRFRCQPAAAEDIERVQPVFESTRYGDPEYMQLAAACPAEIGTGADDESEMGAFHDLLQPLRVAYLVARLNEHLRFGLEAGIFFAT